MTNFTVKIIERGVNGRVFTTNGTAIDDHKAVMNALTETYSHRIKKGGFDLNTMSFASDQPFDGDNAFFTGELLVSSPLGGKLVLERLEITVTK